MEFCYDQLYEEHNKEFVVVKTKLFPLNNDFASKVEKTPNTLGDGNKSYASNDLTLLLLPRLYGYNKGNESLFKILSFDVF